MSDDVFCLPARDGLRLHAYRWQPPTPPKGVLLLAHGMAEHAGRYARLGLALNAAGYALYGHDQRGHGETAATDQLGLFAYQNGWRKLLDDLDSMAAHVAAEHPGTPIYLLGHSMGSYIGQAWLMRQPNLQGAILSGSTYHPALYYRCMRPVALLERWRQGAEGRSGFIEWLSFSRMNERFKPNRTRFDWLSSLPAEVDRFIQDPLCGFRCTNQLWLDLLAGLDHISQPRHLAEIAPDLPLLIIGGECDPVSAGKRLNDLSTALRRAGSREVQLNLYSNARHELFNESHREEVTADVVAWLDKHLPGTATAQDPSQSSRTVNP